MEKTRDPDRKIPKKQRREENQEEGRTPYQPGGRQGETPIKTPTKDRNTNSLTPGGEGKTNRRDSRFGLCNGCGIEHPNPRVMTPKGFDHSGCRYYEKNHPDYNYDNVAWADSTQGKIYAKCGKKTLAPLLMILNGVVVNKGNGLPFNKRPASDAGMTKPHSLKTYILPGTLSYRNGDAISARIQLDTGNQGRTLVRRDKAMMLVSQTVVRPHEIVYTMPNGSTMASSGSVRLNVAIIFDQLINDYEVLENLSFDIVETFEDPNVDCIISGDDITANQILVRIPKQHEEPIVLPEPFVTERIENTNEPRNFYLSAITRSDSRRQHISEFFDFEQEDMGEPEKEDFIDEVLQIKSPMEPKPEPVVEGSEKFQKEMREMLREYIDLLQSEVSKEPAKVAPLVLNVDEKRWTLPKANARHRTQSTDKDKEIKRQVDLMVALGLIQKCNRTHYSQVHLVPKPHGKWRFCIDYRYLNDCS